MRNAVLLSSILAVCVSAAPSAQRPEFIQPEFLESQFAVPDGAPSTVVLTVKNEPGEPLVVTGRTLDGARPISGVSLFVFHTDANGVYATGMSNSEGEFHPRLHGAIRTDAEGRYKFTTIRPGSYNAGPSHVHYIVTARGYKPLLLALQFEDDPIVVRKRKSGTPLMNPQAFQKGPCKGRPDCVLTQPVTRDAQGVFHVTRDIQLVKE